MAKNEVFGKVTAYYFKGKLYKTRPGFLNAVAETMFASIKHTVGKVHEQEEGTRWGGTRRARAMHDRRFDILDKAKRRVDRIV